MKFKLQQRGFSLVETMVAVGLTAGLGYILMQQSDMSNKQQQKANFNSLVNSEAVVAQKVLSRSENCTASLRNLKFGTTVAPTIVTEVRKGIANLATTPPTITSGELILKTQAPNASGVYIESMHLITRPGDNKDVLRVTYVSGDISGGVVRNRAKGLGSSRIPKDFVMMTQKRADGTIESCYSEASNLLATSCSTMPDGQWNATTQKCTINGIVKRSDLIQLWQTKDGTLTMNKPADAKNGEVTCQKSSKRCSRTNNDCSLPACPPNHYRSGEWEWDRKQSTWDYACMKSANCMYQAQPAGWMVKP